MSISIPSNGGRDLEQFRAELQSRMLRCRQVNFEANFLFFWDKLDHAAALDEMGHIAHS